MLAKFRVLLKCWSAFLIFAMARSTFFILPYVRFKQHFLRGGFFENRIWEVKSDAGQFKFLHRFPDSIKPFQQNSLSLRWHLSDQIRRQIGFCARDHKSRFEILSKQKTTRSHCSTHKDDHNISSYETRARIIVSKLACFVENCTRFLSLAA